MRQADIAAQLTRLVLAHDALGQVCEAIVHYEQALAIARETGDRRGEANRLSNLSEVYEKLGERAHAIACQRQAVAIWEELQLPQLEQVRQRLAELEAES